MRKYGDLLKIFAIFMMFIGTMLVPVGGSEPFAPVPDPYHNANVHVNVTFENGSAADGYSVLLRSIYSGPIYQDTTDSLGNVELSIPHQGWGPCDLYVKMGSGPNQAFEKVLIEPDGHHYFNITLSLVPTDNVTIKGRISDRQTDGIITGIDVRVQTSDIFDNQVLLMDTTGMDGVYEIKIPEPKGIIKVTALSTPDHETSWVEIFRYQDEMEIEVDLSLQPKNYPTNKVAIRFTNSTSGTPLYGDYLYVGGFNSEREHLSQSDYLYSPNSTNWWNLDIPKGEFQIYWNDHDILENLSLRAKTQIYTNGSDMTIDLQLDIPKMITLEVEVVNSSGPLNSAQITWNERHSTYYGEFEIEGRAYTNSSGRAFISVIQDRTTEFDLYGSGHQRMARHYTPQENSTEGAISVLMVETASEQGNEMAHATITVIDELSGVPVPNAGLDLIWRTNDDEFHIYEHTNDTGVFSGQLPVAFYDIITAENKLGTGIVENIEITTSGENNITILMDIRGQHPEDPVEIFFHVKNMDGDPLKDQFLYLNDLDVWKSSFLRSDEDGRVNANVVPGPYSRVSNDENLFYRQPWIGKDSIVIPPEGGQIDDLVLYPVMPLEEVTGHVKDHTTGQMIVDAHIDSRSYYILDDAHDLQSYPEEGEDGVKVADLDVKTDTGGFFRTYGVNALFLQASKQGYFPESRSRRMIQTRSDQVVEFELDPIPRSSVWMNGTVLDQDGASISSYIHIWDSDHTYGEPLFYNDGGSGSFDIFLYPGTFLIGYGNETLTDEVIVSVGENGTENIELVLRPTTFISGNVIGWNGTGIAGENITLETIIENGNNTFVSMETISNGSFIFQVTRGNFILHVDGTDIYFPYTTEILSTDGWTEIVLTIMMMNRTTADLSGMVLGIGGDHDLGIPFTQVDIFDPAGEVVASTITDGSGRYSFYDMLHGHYMILASPHDDLSLLSGIRSGYVNSDPFNITIEGVLVEFDLSLEFVMIDDEMFVHILETLPVGSNVSLDEPIVIMFSHEMNRTMLEEAFSIDPEPRNITFLWIDGAILVITHNGLDTNTTYLVTFDGIILSSSMLRIENWTGLSWNFSTGNEGTSFSLWLQDLVLDDEGNLTIVTWGKGGMTVYIVVEGLGSYLMIESGIIGQYSVRLPITDMEYNTTYNYHFSDSDGGPDLSPELVGAFTTPIAPTTVDDDVDDDTEDEEDNDEGLPIGSIIGMIIVSILLIFVIAILIILALRMMNGHENIDQDGNVENWDDDEEAESWGDGE